MRLAKTTRPELLAVLIRERLFERLDTGSERGAVWVSGPPGAGKTTLVSSYVETRGLDHIWYQLDSGDADIATLFHYLRQAIAKHSKTDPDTYPRTSPTDLTDTRGYAQRYFRDVFTQLSDEFVLVFDNYQDLPSLSTVHEAMRTALDELPKGGRIVFISRNDPPAEMARLRANQTLKLVSYRDLKLTRDELGDVAALRGQPLGADALRQLYERTEGWAAGAVLLLEHAKSVTRATDFPESQTPQVLFDYLAGETFETFEPQSREVLMRLSMLPQMTMSMAVDLAGTPEASPVLRKLTRNDYFVSERKTDDEVEYQLHPLFRKFLLTRAQSSFSPAAIRSLRASSANLCERHGRIEDAVSLYLQNEDWSNVAKIVGLHASGMLEHSRGETVAEWLDNLPEEIFAGKPWLLYWAGASHFYSSTRAARTFYQRAFEAFSNQTPEDRKGTVLSCCGVIDTILYELDDLTQLDQWIKRLEDLTGPESGSASKSLEARVTSSMFMALVMRQPSHPGIRTWVERAYALSQSRSDPELRMSIEPLVAVAIMWTGHFARAREVIDSMRELRASHRLSAVALITLKVVESMYFMLFGEHKKCIDTVAEGVQLSRDHGVRIWGNLLLIHGAGAALGAGDLQTALKYLDEVETTRSNRRMDWFMFHYFSAWHAVLRGETMDAFHHQKIALKVALEVGCPFFEVLSRLAMAQVLYMCGDEGKGAASLRKVHGVARDIQNRLLEFMTLLAYAQIALDHGRRRSGLNSLRYAFGLGRENGYGHCLWWQPEAMSRLCACALEEGIEVEYVRDLIRTRNLAPPDSLDQLAQWPWPFLVYSFGKFRLLKHDKAVEISPKGHGRPVLLLKLLVAFGGREVRAEQLAGIMWPHVDGDYAYRSFTTTLHRLRKLLGEDTAVMLQDGRVSLNDRLIWMDTWALEATVQSLERSLRESEPLTDDELSELAEKLLGIYTGAFLEDENEQPVFVAQRQHLRGKFLRASTRLTRCWEQVDNWSQVADFYERALEADSLSEPLYRNLMLCYEALHKPGEAADVFERCRATFGALLNITPGVETQQLHQRICGRPNPA